MNTMSDWSLGATQVGLLNEGKPQYGLRVAPHVVIAQRQMPNAWHRFWMRLLLGWTWEKIS